MGLPDWRRRREELDLEQDGFNQDRLAGQAKMPGRPAGKRQETQE
jgi:hypothetical protein